ncbi:hypothetical protein [Agrobacterium salinitolerans]|uniref:hypothetical protein n=1 Tax=Agrobacterium salinitolerans TaxID=1183413 RepID=UPI001571B52D|nr:hypothetical protein [Agrobacterium salinitolerans]NTA36832.1 hypothetical protein [Agrobacterium salinitolerans]
MTSERQFPVLNATGRITSVPWRLVAPHEEQAKKNHGGQSLERLAQRGGLSWPELFAVMADEEWFKCFRVL